MKFCCYCNVFLQEYGYKINYYPNLVILPVDNNEHQRIDDVFTI